MPADAADRLPDTLLAEAARRVARGVRVSTVAPERRDRAIALLDEATAILGQEETPGPYWLTGLTSFDQFDLTADLALLHTYSPALGDANPFAPHVELEVTEDKVVQGTVTFAEIHNGPPWNTCHGGVVALVYDDIVGLAAMVAAGGGMTARLTIDYRKPTPLFEPVTFRAWLEHHEDRKFFARGEMRHGDTLLSEAEGLFIRPKGFPPGTSTG
ncbi:PaaI family thioesterase [Aquihabitans daechungensis]|uniref:PaaI family thioesterase n=1 Tax=Aquihabitans daechungensis TaxID=1052257 RepID=UPI003BA38983